MIRVAQAVARLAGELTAQTAAIGAEVRVDLGLVGERARFLKLNRPGTVSANGACRMVEAADGWLAVNLPRESDLLSVPAWIGCDLKAEPWTAIARAARTRPAADLVDEAQGLGLAVAQVGSVNASSLLPPLHRLGGGGATSSLWRTRAPRVIDMSSLWAGPLCGDLLATAGAEVIKLESDGRPDTTRLSSPEFHARLNGRKTPWRLDFANPSDLAQLRDALAVADLVITSARPRAFEQLDLAPETLFAANPSLVWVAITAYGWMGVAGERVGFGDDAAAAGGLVRWSAEGRPRFLGDAVADPLSGLAAAVGAFHALSLGGGLLVDAALASTAAGVAAGVRLEMAS